MGLRVKVDPYCTEFIVKKPYPNDPYKNLGCCEFYMGLLVNCAKLKVPKWISTATHRGKPVSCQLSHHLSHPPVQLSYDSTPVMHTVTQSQNPQINGVEI